MRESRDWRNRKRSWRSVASRLRPTLSNAIWKVEAAQKRVVQRALETTFDSAERSRNNSTFEKRAD
jgi:hypothetical protein